MALTQQAVIAAATALADAGQTPTLAAVRRELGGGSYTTISGAMSEWRRQQAAKSATGRGPLPEEVAIDLQQFGARLWAAASDAANARLATQREALAAAAQQLEADKGEIAALADSLNAELEAAKRMVAEIASERDGVATELAATTRRAAAGEALTAALTARVEELSAEMRQLFADRDAERRAHMNEVRQLHDEFASERTRQEARYDDLVHKIATATTATRKSTNR